MPAERLLPGTKALGRGTVEVIRRGDKWLVRFRTAAGYVRRLEVKDPAEADRVFWSWVREMKLGYRKPAAR